MKEFSRKTMCVKLTCTCVNQNYFDEHFISYYDFLTCELIKSKSRGSYVKKFYKLKPYDYFDKHGCGDDLYCELPFFVCASRIYW